MKALSLVLTAILVGCSAEDLGGPTPAHGNSASPNAPGGSAELVAYGQNIYVGANVDAVLPALLSGDPATIVQALMTAAGVLGETDFTTRAAGIAAEIDRSRPHVVGLNEISTIDLDLRPLGVPLLVHEDFLPELLAALSARGLNYVVAGQKQGLTANPPLPLGAVVRVIDRDVLLVDADRVTAGSPIERNYTYNIGDIATGVSLVRSFVIVPVMIEGRRYTAAVTHLESDLAGFPSFSMLRAAQATELAAYLPAAQPAVVVGDLNDVPGSLMHQVLVDAGFDDVWQSFHPNQEGFTCCQDDNLGNPQSGHLKRIDYALARGFDGPQGDLTGQVKLFGVNRSDLLAGPAHPIWPADHAGVITRLRRPTAVLP